MKKMKSLMAILFLAGLILTAGVVSAKGTEKTPVKVLDLGKELGSQKQPTLQPNEENRMIVQTTSGIDKLIFRLKGCKIIHELNSATAIKCPKGMAIKGAKPDRIFELHDLEADVQINANDVWNTLPTGYDGTGVKVAILDGGVDETHIELSDSVVLTKNFVEPESSYDKDGHGTHVSGIVTANGIYTIDSPYDNRPPNKATGVAPGASLIVGKVCGQSGCYESSVIAGIEWAVSEGANVISMSFGTPTWHTINEDCDADGGLIVDSVNNAVYEKGVTVVISAGNEGDTAMGISSPACASGAIAVGAVDKNDKMAGFSNHGPALDLVAPGVDILSTYSCIAANDCTSYWYAWMSGTSMAAPHIAGVVALMLESKSTLEVDEIKTALYETATHISSNSVCYGEVKRGKRYFIGKVSCSPDNYGAGIVDAYNAVNYIPSIDCYNDADCNDDNECTEDSCVYSGTTNSYCVNVDKPDTTECSNGICCAGTCCVDATECIDRCSTCHKSVCDDKCNLAKEDASCPDCQ